MSLLNRSLNGCVDTVFLMSDARYLYVISSLIKNTAVYGGNVEQMVPPCVFLALQEKFPSLRTRLQSWFHEVVLDIPLAYRYNTLGTVDDMILDFSKIKFIPGGRLDFQFQELLDTADYDLSLIHIFRRRCLLFSLQGESKF